MGLILAIDGGSQSTKVSLVAHDGRVVGSNAVALRPYRLGPDGYAVHPDDDLWDSLVAAVADLGAGLDEVTAVGLCSIRYCRSYLRQDGTLFEPVLSWMDPRVNAPPPADGQIRWVTTASGYLTHRLTGEHTDTAGNYQGWWPVDPRTWSWSEDEQDFRDTGMHREQLFDLVDPGAPLGRITETAARATGIPAGSTVYATSNDKAVEALGCGIIHPGQLLLSLGTYIASMTPAGPMGGPAGTSGALLPHQPYRRHQPQTDAADSPAEPAHWTNFACVPGGLLLESDGIRRGMWTLGWLGEFSGRSIAELTRLAENVPSGSRGLLTILDWLAPPGHSHRRGTILGLNAEHGPGEVFRSLLEGICLTMADHADAMVADVTTGSVMAGSVTAGSGGRGPTEVVVCGGGSRSDLMMGIAADCFSRPAIRMQAENAAGIGAAICAAFGAGTYSSWQDAVSAMTHQDRLFVPSEHEPDYQVLRGRHRRAREALDEVYRRLADPGEVGGPQPGGVANS
ncbi:MAG: FGGY-family carbohydrate kinase [Actinomycetales bacterium]